MRATRMKAGSMTKSALTSITALMLSGCLLANAPEDAATEPSNVPRAEQPADCPTTGVALQVLGSGGPIAEADRAGTSYLLWIDGEARLLIDAGSGSFLRYAEAGAKLADLDAILLTHLHADHAGDVIDILNSGGFEGRTQPLAIVGPGSASRFPSTSEFVARLLDKESGAFAYNGGYLDGDENKPSLTFTDVNSMSGMGDMQRVVMNDDIMVLAYPVDHGPVPALGYEIRVDGKTFVITGDQSGRSVVFREALRGSNPAVLFAHHVINGERGQPRGLHRTPEEIGELAAALEPERLVLTHNMQRSLSRIEDGLAAIALGYSGPVSVASDLDCYAL